MSASSPAAASAWTSSRRTSRKLGGIIDIYSEQGIGTKFTVTLPITLAIISALIVHVEGRTFAIPLSSVQEAIWLDPGAVRKVEGQEMMTLRGIARSRSAASTSSSASRARGPRSCDRTPSSWASGRAASASSSTSSSASKTSSSSRSALRSRK